MKDPNHIAEGSHEETIAINEFLAKTEEYPIDATIGQILGFSKQRVVDNRRKWRKQAKKDFHQYEDNLTTAYTIIYRSYTSHIKPTILSESLNALQAWTLLKKTYSNASFDSLYTHIDILYSIDINKFKNIESYTNTFKNAQQCIDHASKALNKDILSTMFLHGLSDRFKQVRWDVTYSATTLSLSDVIGYYYTTKHNFVKNKTQLVKIATPKKGKLSTSSKPNNKSNK